MKKILTLGLAFFLSLGFTTSLKAQISIGAKVGIALPMGILSDVCGVGFGGSAIGDYALNENMAIGLNIGYYKFATKSNEIAGGPGYAYEYPALTIIPIIVDFKYVFKTEGFMPYVGAGLGVYVSKFAETTLAGYVVASSSSSSDFGFSPKVGFWMGDGIKYGASLEYNMVSNANHLGINVGLAFPLGK